MAAAIATAVVSDPPRPSVVISLESALTPWKPATSAMPSSFRAAWMRPGVTSMIRASPCFPVVIIPAWEPVNDRAVPPRALIAMASSALEMRSPEVSSMSSSRGGGLGWTASARSVSSSVVSPIAEATTTTSLPSLRVRRIRSATRLMRSADWTDDPPYFWTTSATSTDLRLPGVLRDHRPGDRTGPPP